MIGFSTISAWVVVDLIFSVWKATVSVITPVVWESILCVMTSIVWDPTLYVEPTEITDIK